MLPPNAYVSDGDILDIFNPDVVSASTVKQTFDEVTDQLDTIVYGVYGAVLNSATIMYDIAGQLRISKELQTKSEQHTPGRSLMNCPSLVGYVHT